MNILSLLSFFSFLLCLYFGLHILRREPKATLSQVFFAYCATGMIWSFGYVFIYPATDIKQIWFWYRFTSFGWCFIHSTLLHFILILTEKKRLLSRWWIYAVLYLPSCILLWRSLTGILIAENFYQTPLGTAEIIASKSVWFNIYGLYNIAALFIACILLWLWGRKSNIMRYKKQARLVIVTTIASFLMASFFNMVIPVLGIQVPAIGALFSTTIIIGAWVAMSRYKLLVLTPEIAAGEIISKMLDIMILTDPHDTVIVINRQAEELTGFSSSEFRGKSLYDLIAEKEFLREKMNRIKDSSISNFQFDGNLITKEGGNIPVTFFCSDFKDTAGEVVGVVLVAHDQRDTINLKAAIEEIRVTNAELISTRDLLWGEMHIAKKIQTVLLPADPAISGYRLATFMRPAEEVGGDYYDILNAGGRDWLIIGDVSGHGVPSGLIMMIVQTAIHAMISDNPDVTPAELVRKVNLSITPSIKKIGLDRYMTIMVSAVHQDGRFIFSGLHQDILIHRKAAGRIDVLETRGMWLGLIDDIADMVQDDSCRLEIGDTLLVFTDGITEACVPDNPDTAYDDSINMFGIERLMDVFSRSCAGSVEEIKNSIISSLEGFSCNDDITLVVLRREK